MTKFNRIILQSLAVENSFNSKLFYYAFALTLLVSVQFSALAQNYDSYFTGSSSDISTIPSGGVCLMGGATEDDNAMTWFLERANGGDILVLRASGSDGYNDYLFSELGVNVNSVETIVFNNASASNESYIQQKIQQAEAIWFAGGDQWDYVSYWRNTEINSLINEAISERNIVIGGTSAGMAIQGGYYFSAENGTVTSAAALSNPYDSDVTVDSTPFLSNEYLSDVITDTHYDSPDRKGRQVVFLSRIFTDSGIQAKGIACDEYTAVCIDPNGMASVYGGYPSYDDNAYFLQTNCELADLTPENCSPGNPLTWNLGNAAIKVYHVKGTSDGANTFDLNDWETGEGGTWENWYVQDGVLFEQESTQPDCLENSVSEVQQNIEVQVYPNPAGDYIIVKFSDAMQLPKSIEIKNSIGQVVLAQRKAFSTELQLNTNQLSPGIYLIHIRLQDNISVVKKLKVM